MPQGNQQAKADGEGSSDFPVGGRRRNVPAQAFGQSRRGWEFPSKKETFIQRKEGDVKQPMLPSLY